jgi:hypothetical protein
MTTTSRQAPGGSRLLDGYQTLIAFAADPDVSLWERTVKPPGIDGGDEVDTTTMHNEEVRTFGPRSLKTMTASTFTAAYDPEVYDQIMALCNENGWITVHFPDGSGIDFAGYLKTFEPADISEGEMPEATVTIVCTNQIDGVETLPDYKPAASMA